MSKSFLISGIAGTGKSSVCKELNILGQKAYDIEDIDGMFKMYRKGTRDIFYDYDNTDPEKIKNAEWICDKNLLKELLNKQTSGSTFYCGVASNMEEIIPFFDRFILLKTDPVLLYQRLAARKGTDDMGNTEEGRKAVLGWKEWWENEMIEKGALVVNADGNPKDVAQKVINLVRE